MHELQSPSLAVGDNPLSKPPPNVERLYCLIRTDETGPPTRLRQVFDFHRDVLDPARVMPIEGELKDGALA